MLGPGFYDVVASNCCPGQIISGGSWEVSFTATVVQIPEPGTLLLLLSGVVATGFACRRERAADGR